MRGGGGDWTTEASKLGSQVDLDAAGVTVEEADRFVSLLHATKPPPARPYYEQDQARAALLYQLAANRRAPDAPGGSWEDPSGRVPPSRAIPERAADRHARVPRVSRAQRQLLCYLRFNMHTACRASTSKALLDLFEQQDPSNTRSVSVRKFFRVLEYATGVEVTVERERLLLEAFRDAVDDDAVDYFSFVTALMRETHDLRLPDGADAPRGSRVKMTQSCVFDDLQLLRPRSPHSGRELSIEELRAAEERPMVRAPGHGRQGPAQEQFMTDHQRALRAIPARRSPAAVRSRPGADPATSASSRSLAKWLDGSSSAVADPAGTEEETKKNKQGDNFGSDDRDTTNRSSMALQDTVDARAVADLTGAVKLQPAAVAPRRSAMSPPGRQVSRGGRVAFPEYPVIQVAGDEGGIGTDSRPYLLPGSVEEDYLRVESPPESTIGANSPISAMAQSSQRDRLTAQPLQKNFSANDAKLLPTGRNHSLSADAGRYTSSGNFTALRAQQTTEGVGVGLAGRQGASHDGDDSLVVRIAQALRAASPDRGAARSEASLAETRADETDVMSTARRIAAALQSAKVSDQGSGGPLREATWSVEYRNKVHPAVMADKLRHGSEACEPGDWAPSNVVNRGIGARQRAEAFARSKEKLLENSRAKGANWSMEHPGGATQPAQWASTMRDAQERRVRAETPTLRERLSSKQRGGAHLRAVPWSVAERHLVHLQRSRPSRQPPQALPTLWDSALFVLVAGTITRLSVCLDQSLCAAFERCARVAGPPRASDAHIFIRLRRLTETLRCAGSQLTAPRAYAPRRRVRVPRGPPYAPEQWRPAPRPGCLPASPRASTCGCARRCARLGLQCTWQFRQSGAHGSDRNRSRPTPLRRNFR